MYRKYHSDAFSTRERLTESISPIPPIPPIPPMPPIPGMPGIPIPGIPPMPPMSKSSSTAALSPSCSSSSTHLEKSVLMNALRTFSLVRRGQYSAFTSFLRSKSWRERDVRFFEDCYGLQDVSDPCVRQWRVNGTYLGYDLLEQIDRKLVVLLFNTLLGARARVYASVRVLGRVYRSLKRLTCPPSP